MHLGNGTFCVPAEDETKPPSSITIRRHIHTYIHTYINPKQTMDAQRGPDAMPAAAAGTSSGDAAESFVEWASKQRQRAARDGAWKVVVAERMVNAFLNGNIERTVTSWHDSAKRQPTPLRRAQQHDRVSADRSQQQSTRSANDQQLPQRQTA